MKKSNPNEFEKYILKYKSFKVFGNSDFLYLGILILTILTIGFLLFPESIWKLGFAIIVTFIFTWQLMNIFDNPFKFKIQLNEFRNQKYNIEKVEIIDYSHCSLENTNISNNNIYTLKRVNGEIVTSTTNDEIYNQIVDSYCDGSAHFKGFNNNTVNALISENLEYCYILVNESPPVPKEILVS